MTNSHPISLSYYTVPELDPPEMVTVAAAAGCDHIGLRLLDTQPGGRMPPIMRDAGLRRETRARLRETGLSVLDANTARLVPETDVSAYRPFLEVAAEMGARHALATANDPHEARLDENLAALCEMAATYGMTVQVEFVPWLAIADLPSADRLASRVGHPNLGIAIDALHFHRSGGTPADIARVPPERFAYLHLCDAPAAWDPEQAAQLHVATRERLFPGEGEIDLVGLLRAVPPAIPVALEIPTEALARTTAAPARVARAVAACRAVLLKSRQQEMIR